MYRWPVDRTVPDDDDTLSYHTQLVFRAPARAVWRSDDCALVELCPPSITVHPMLPVELNQMILDVYRRYLFVGSHAHAFTSEPVLELHGGLRADGLTFPTAVTRDWYVFLDLRRRASRKALQVNDPIKAFCAYEADPEVGRQLDESAIVYGHVGFGWQACAAARNPLDGS